MPLPPQITDNTNYTSAPNGGVVKLTWAPSGVYYGYCTIADVEYEFPNQDSFVTLTSSVIAQEITAAAQEMQDQLARFYAMPYTGTDAGILHTLRQINAKLATANLIARYFQGAEPNLSPAAVDRRAWAELILTDIEDGRIQWSTPFGDATPMSEQPLYPLSAGATVMPDPNSLDPYASQPLFTMHRTKFRRGSLT